MKYHKCVKCGKKMQIDLDYCVECVMEMGRKIDELLSRKR